MSGPFSHEHGMHSGWQPSSSAPSSPYSYSSESSSQSIWHGKSPDSQVSPPPYHEHWRSLRMPPHSHPFTGEYLSIKQLTKFILQRRVDLPIFLTVFSLSGNFEPTLEAFGAQCSVPPIQLLENPVQLLETQVCVLLALDFLVARLWLNSQQYRKLNQFVPQILRSNRSPAVEYALEVFVESLHKSKSANIGNPDESLAAFRGNPDMKVLANKLTRSLAMLESQLRKDDPIGECIRWLARGRDRDFLSFSERVRNWVLRSILTEAKPIDVKRCYQLFVDVAKQSRDIYNFSSARSISLALIDLDLLRCEFGVDGTQISALMDMDPRRLVKAKSYGQPFLLHISDVLSTARITVQAPNIVNAYGVNWRQCQELHYELQDFISHSDCQLLSSQQYGFTEDQLLSFVKMDLIKSGPVDDIPNKIQHAFKEYEKATKPKIFRSKTRP